MPKASSVFISHSSRDRELACLLSAELEKLGLATSEPLVAPGYHWRETVQSAIKKADSLVLLITAPTLASSSWMGYEAGLADALNKRIVVAASDRLSLAELPSDFSSFQMVRVDPGAPALAARAIADRLSPRAGMVAG